MKVLLHPGCWERLYPLNLAWDEELWNDLETHGVEFIGSHHAIINGKKVWYSNHAYASGSPNSGEGKDRFLCSRATALLLLDKIKKKRIFQVLTGPYNPIEVYKKYGISFD